MKMIMKFASDRILFNMMCASDRILYDEGYQKSPCQTTYDIILILQDNGEYEAEHFDKIMNGWLRFIGDVTCEDADKNWVGFQIWPYTVRDFGLAPVYMSQYS